MALCPTFFSFFGPFLICNKSCRNKLLLRPHILHHIPLISARVSDLDFFLVSSSRIFLASSPRLFPRDKKSWTYIKFFFFLIDIYPSYCVRKMFLHVIGKKCDLPLASSSINHFFSFPHLLSCTFKSSLLLLKRKLFFFSCLLTTFKCSNTSTGIGICATAASFVQGRRGKKERKAK